MTFEQVGMMSLQDLHDLQSSWEESPPVSLMVAAYMGIKREEPVRIGKDSLAELASFMGGK